MFVLSSLKFRNWIGYVNNREFEEINICLHLSNAPQEPQPRNEEDVETATTRGFRMESSFRSS